jgi:hypothetical protein
MYVWLFKKIWLALAFYSAALGTEKIRSHLLTHQVSASHFFRSVVTQFHPCKRKFVFVYKQEIERKKTNFLWHGWHRIITERQKLFTVTRWVGEWLLFFPFLLTLIKNDIDRTMCMNNVRITLANQQQCQDAL